MLFLNMVCLTVALACFENPFDTDRNDKLFSQHRLHENPYGVA
jgi:hypothetical protein